MKHIKFEIEVENINFDHKIDYKQAVLQKLNSIPGWPKWFDSKDECRKDLLYCVDHFEQRGFINSTVLIVSLTETAIIKNEPHHTIVLILNKNHTWKDVYDSIKNIGNISIIINNEK